MILLAFLFFFVIGFVSERNRAREGRSVSDTTQVSTDSESGSGSDASSGDDASDGKPTSKPTGDSPSDPEAGLPEIRPVTGDSTF